MLFLWLLVVVITDGFTREVSYTVDNTNECESEDEGSEVEDVYNTWDVEDSRGVKLFHQIQIHYIWELS